MKTIPHKKTEKAQQGSQDRVDERLMVPGTYEIIPDNNTFTVDVHLIQVDGRWIRAEKAGSGVHSESAVFRMWTFQEMVDLRKMATSFDASKRMHMVDNDALNRLKVQKLLMSWTFSDKNERLKIHRNQGTLTDESWTNFTKLQANIAQALIEGMNNVLEFNY